MVTVSELDDEAPDTEAPNDDSVSEPLPAVAPATIRQMTREHWQAVRRIYADGLTSGDASFELKPPGWDEFQQSHLADHQLVAIDDSKVVGWAALSPVSERCAYAGVAESSVYVAARSRGRGVGSQILSQLVWRAEMAGIWTVQAGIFPENVRASRFTTVAAFVPSGCESDSASETACGETCCSWNAEADWSLERHARAVAAGRGDRHVHARFCWLWGDHG